MLEAVNAVEGILQRLGDVRLNVGSTGTGVGSDDHNVGRLGLRHQFDGETREGEEPKYRYRHIDKGGGDGLSNGCFVDTHREERCFVRWLAYSYGESILERRGS